MKGAIEIIDWGRLLYWVRSDTRDMWHLVDLEREDRSDGTRTEGDRIEESRCSCEAYKFHKHRPCKHILYCLHHLLDVREIAGADRLDDHERVQAALFLCGLLQSKAMPEPLTFPKPAHPIREDAQLSPEAPARRYTLKPSKTYEAR